METNKPEAMEGITSRNKKAPNKELQVVLRETGILTAITLIAGLLLGFVHELTKEPIRIQQERAVQEACRAVFSQEPGAVFEEVEHTPSTFLAEELAEDGVTIGTIYQAVRADGTDAGYVIQTTSSQGYGGDIVLYVGITTEGVLNDVSILSISETPGLGMQAGKVLLPQFHEKQVEEFTYTKTGSTQDSELDAISGATITTRAVTNAVNGALKASRELTGGVDHE